MQTSESQCERRTALTEVVQQNLLRLAELARAEAAAVKSGDAEIIAAIDHQIEHVLGEKERSMGALRQHRIEHGC